MTNGHAAADSSYTPGSVHDCLHIYAIIILIYDLYIIYNIYYNILYINHPSAIEIMPRPVWMKPDSSTDCMYLCESSPRQQHQEARDKLASDGMGASHAGSVHITKALLRNRGEQEIGIVTAVDRIGYAQRVTFLQAPLLAALPLG